ncbi:MAG: hypothetical protein JWQ36_352 [Enterovirga sp.]|jgi:hypothetical protein|nr:hypothetical protein [Enterovirga sp.]
MTPDSIGLLSRPFSVANLPSRGTEVRVEATADELAALAKHFDLAAIHSLSARLHVKGSPARVHVTGTLKAAVVQTCVVTLEPFETALEEEVEVTFRAPMPGEDNVDPAEEVEADLDAPDQLVGDRIDLGAITVEFLSLGLDPYPRKPGVEFDAAPAGAADEGGSAFAALKRLRDKDA